MGDILKRAVEKWVNDFPEKEKREETRLAKLISTMVEEEHMNSKFHSDAEVSVNHQDHAKPSRIDILFSPKDKAATDEQSTPLAIVEVGRKDLDWWKKVDQNF